MTNAWDEQLDNRRLLLEELPVHCRPVADDECLLLVGSIAEGLANPDSDIDLLLLGTRAPFSDFALRQAQFDVETVHVSDLAEVSTEVVEPTLLERFEATMREIAQVLDQPESMQQLPILGDYADVKLLHRIRTGVPLVNPELVDRWRARLRTDLLPEAIAVSATMEHFAIREDGISHALEDDFETASVCFRAAASQAATMLLAGIGQTNPSPRWGIRLLRRHAAVLGADRVEALVGAILGEVRTRQDVEARLAVFDDVIIDAAGKLPRVASVGGGLAARFPVHSHLGDDDLLDRLAPPPTPADPAADRAPEPPGTPAPPPGPHEEVRERPAVIDRILNANRVSLGRAVRDQWPLAALRTVDGRGDGTISVDGIPSVMLASNDYLGLRWHPEVLEGAERALRTYGSGAGGSRLMAGSVPLHHQLQDELADHLGQEAVLLFPSGYQANVGVLSALLGRNDLAICDDGVHASLIDGCRLGQSTIRRFDRRQLQTLDRLLSKREGGRFAASVLIADAVYSMDGDTLPLTGMLERLQAHRDPLFVVDEAHAIGVVGDHGQGLVASTEGGARVDLVTGNLSKSLASMGGFVAGPAEVVGALSFLSRSFLFSTAGNPAALGAALAALRILRSEPERRIHALALADRLRAGLHHIGIETGDSDSLIIPGIVGDDLRAVALAHGLAKRGICVGCAVSPAVAPGRAILRFSITAELRAADIDRAVETLGELLAVEQGEASVAAVTSGNG